MKAGRLSLAPTLLIRMVNSFHEVRIHAIHLECTGVKSLELVRADGGAILGQSPGAHIDVRLPQGQVRSYSLIDVSRDGRRCRIAVKREAHGRGASKWLHDVASVGTKLGASAPVNHFPLVEEASRSVLVAGGIGITPVLSMIRRLSELGRAWELHYAAASAECMPFHDEITQLAQGAGASFESYRSDTGTRRMDLATIVSGADAGTHLYCCGPARMIDAFIDAAQDRSSGTVHFERFGAAKEAAIAGGIQIRLARAGRSLTVPHGQTILDTLVKAGINVPFSCSQGVCGTCQVSVVAGVPDHRDDYLTEAEKSANNVILVCCSGARTPSLTLDL